jgi:hypothetical protein
MQGSMQAWVRSRCGWRQPPGSPPGFGAAENLEIGSSTLPTFREPKVSTRTNIKVLPGMVLPLLETRQVGADLWYRVDLPNGPAWVVGKSSGTTYAFATSAPLRTVATHETTPNGWPAYKSHAKGIIVPTSVLGVKPTLWAAKGATPALAAMVRWWDQNVGPVKLLGSHNYRPIKGTSSLSNHSSGTAVDINGCWRGVDGSLPGGCAHPYKEATVPERLKPAIRAKAKELGLRWGGDYKSAPLDEMHFEVAMDPASFAAFWANKGAPEMAPVTSFERATDSARSLLPGGEPPTRQAREWTAGAGAVLPVVGVVGVGLLAWWALVPRARY